MEARLAALEGGEAALSFAGGMAAISALFLDRLGSGDHLILSNVCYAGVAELAHDILPKHGIAVTTVDTSNPDAVAAAMRPNTMLVHIETPANPILRLSHIAAVATVTHTGRAELSVDAIIATPLGTKPLAFGADYVVHSLTKYICGHGDALGGAVIGRQERIAALRKGGLVHLGGSLSPFAADVSQTFCFRVSATEIVVTVVEDAVFKGRHFDRSVILLCVRWYLAYNLSLRNLEEMMAERGLTVDHATIHRWTVHYAPLLLEHFNQRKRAVTGRWHVDETYIKVRGRGMYLYRAIDSNGDTVEFWFSERRNLSAAKRFLRKALKRHGRPEKIVIDGSQTNKEAILLCDAESRLQDRSGRQRTPIRIRQGRDLNNRIEQDHRAIKRRIRPMLGFQSAATARVILGDIEMVHMMRKQQAKYACNRQLSLSEQFDMLAA